RLRYRSFNGANKALPVLASSLHNAGFDSVVQLDLERPDLSMSEILWGARDADLIAFAGCLSPQWPEIDEHARMIHQHVREIGRTHVPILVGGYATKGVEDIARLTPWINAYFNGEGEQAIVTIVQAVALGSFREKMPFIPGICFLDGNDDFHLSSAPRITNLDPYDQGFG